ncbi:MAG: hypothetical protein HRU15_03165 [Planctomycetes bacterium]|nr:hypothetical protein [Planctomycetota bacterium]
MSQSDMKYLLLIILIFSGCGNSSDATGNNKNYENSVDGKTYVAEGGWKTYESQNPKAITKDKIHLESMRLLTSENEIVKFITISDLSAFVKIAESIVQESGDNLLGPGKLLVQFDCSKDVNRVKLAQKGEAQGEQLQPIYDALSKMDALLGKDGNISFQMVVNINENEAN